MARAVRTSSEGASPTRAATRSSCAIRSRNKSRPSCAAAWGRSSCCASRKEAPRTSPPGFWCSKRRRPARTRTRWRWLLHLAPDPEEAAALLQNAERDLRAAVGLTPSLASAWSTLSHLDYQKNDITQAKIDAQRAYEEDAYLRVADQVVWRLFTTSYDLEQSQDAIHWCAEGHRRFVKNPKFTQCQLWAMTLRDVAPDIPRAWRVVDELRAISSERQWQFDGPMAQILVAGGLGRAGGGDSARPPLPGSHVPSGADRARGVARHQAFVRLLLGDRDQALELLKQYVAANPEHRVGFATSYHWWWRELRDDPRFRQLVGKGN